MNDLILDSWWVVTDLKYEMLRQHRAQLGESVSNQIDVCLFLVLLGATYPIGGMNGQYPMRSLNQALFNGIRGSTWEKRDAWN